MARPRREPESVGSLIPRLLEEIGLDEAGDGMRLLKIWDEALGPELAPHCRPDGIRRGVIRARVRDSSWMQRLQMEKPRVLAALRAELGDAASGDLRLRIGSVD